jgi:hypothetical protein
VSNRRESGERYDGLGAGMLPCGARSSDRLDFFIIGIHVLVPYVMGLGLISLFLILFLVFLDLIL